MTHLLPLASLPARALAVIFGPDGDFEGAPRFTGPVAYDVRSSTMPDLRWYRHLHLGFGLGPEVVLLGDTDSVLLSRCALDLRVPSVAARLAGLCARAMGSNWPDVPWYVRRDITVHGPRWRLTPAAGSERFEWDRHGMAIPTARHLTAIGVPWDDNGPNLDMPAAFLASLTLALADRIGALPAGTDPR